jgi:hypothetical protein
VASAWARADYLECYVLALCHKSGQVRTLTALPSLRKFGFGGKYDFGYVIVSTNESVFAAFGQVDAGFAFETLRPKSHASHCLL